MRSDSSALFSTTLTVETCSEAARSPRKEVNAWPLLSERTIATAEKASGCSRRRLTTSLPVLPLAPVTATCWRVVGVQFLRAALHTLSGVLAATTINVRAAVVRRVGVVMVRWAGRVAFRKGVPGWGAGMHARASD